jgi:hypothetical protein
MGTGFYTTPGSTSDAQNKPTFDDDDANYLIGYQPGKGQPSIMPTGYRVTPTGDEIPQGATITSATLNLLTSITGGLIMRVAIDIWGVDEDDAAVWSDPGNEPEDATLTTATVNHEFAEEFPIPQRFTLDVKDLVQEQVNRGGYSPGNALAYVVKNDSGSSEGNSSWVVSNYDQGENDGATLSVEWEDEGPAVRQIHIASGP